jgi:alkylation response protein AidB-like acyl-CoA dehydrogenase
MSDAPLTQADLAAFRAEVRCWLDANAPNRPPGVELPDSFMEVGTPEQFAVLQAWQRAIYGAGYLGMAWAMEHGGQGRPLSLQRIVTEEMATRNLPFMVNIIGLMWAELLSTAAYASGRVVDDGIIDPRDTRAAVGMALSACHNNEVKGAEGYGVFRM